VACVMGLIDYFGTGHYLNARQIVETVASLFSR
jgi:hypothetical protein